MHDIKTHFINYIARLDQQIARLHQQHRMLSNVRLALFVAGSITAFLCFRASADVFGWLALVAFGIPFVWVARLHKRLESSLRRHRIWRERKQQHLARFQLDWQQMPTVSTFSEEVVSPQHPFSSDLNMVGHRSLHQFLDTTTTLGGSRQLLHWLLQETPNLAETKQRQHWVQILQDQGLFRDKLALLSLETHPKAGTKQHDGKRWDDQALQSWLQSQEQPVPLLPWIIGLSSFAMINLALLWFALPFGILGIALYWLLYITQFPKLKGVFEETQDTQSVLQRFMPPLLYMEKHRSSKLKDLLKTFQSSDQRPSLHSQALSRIAYFSALTRNEFLFVLLNTICPWEMIFTRFLTRAKANLQAHLPKWLAQWFNIEALNALADHAEMHPQATFPTFEDHYHLIQVQSIGHPLIPEASKVRNDFGMKTLGEIALFTGSNMSGKSTFLRTIGVNVVMAFAGGKVDATTFNTKPLRVFSCMNVSDSVHDGLSYFYAEVKRLKALLDASQRSQEVPLFYLIDEIFRGTNNRERLSGSRAYIQTLAQQHALGIVSTHDLDLVQLEKELPNLHNFHFREEVIHQAMTFDYQLRRGACPTTNALKIMQIEGLPVEESILQSS